METVILDKKDEIVMRLVHYFITEENYSPIIVNGVKNEVWLENNDGPYKIIRINSNYIHNNEQLKFDIFKTKSVVKQIKAKTFSFKMNTLNILLDTRDDVKINNVKNMNIIKINDVDEINNNEVLLSSFPDLKDKLIDKNDKLDFVLNVTQDINEKTASDNKIYEDTFKRKPIVITYILIALNILTYFMCLIGESTGKFYLYDLMVLKPLNVVKNHELYRLLSCTFVHAGIFHLFFNMYALYIIGSQIETFIGKWKYLFVYLTSGIVGSMFSVLITKGYSVGASGAIFGLLGCLLYFGYNYRLYLGEVLRSQIIPLIVLNLVLGFTFSESIDNAAHIGGLVAGIISSMAVGIKGKTSKSEKINGWIVLIALIMFLFYMLFK